MGSSFGSGENPPALEVDVAGANDNEGMEDGDRPDEEAPMNGGIQAGTPQGTKKSAAVKGGMDEYEWIWKVTWFLSCERPCAEQGLQPELETSRRTFFL